MSKKSSICLIVFLFCGLSCLSTLALMPPDVYRKMIEDSAVKATAKVVSVKIAATTKYKITNEIKFELIKSYGKSAPPKIFQGSCLSAGKDSMPGPDIYFQPRKDEVVFVTLTGGKKADSNNMGKITSYTKITPELKTALDKKGLSGLKYSVGSVEVK